MCRRLGGTKGGTLRAGDNIFSMEKETKVMNWEQDFFIDHRIVSAVKRVEFVSDRMSYMVLRSRWCRIIALNVHAPSEKKSDDLKYSFYEELEKVFDHFPKYRIKILLGNLMQNWGHDIFKPTIWIDSLHQDSYDNGVRTVMFSTSNSLVVKSRMFPHRNIDKYTWTSPDGKTSNQFVRIMVGKRFECACTILQGS